jgi:DNA-binding response OmpR family regulator
VSRRGAHPHERPAGEAILVIGEAHDVEDLIRRHLQHNGFSALCVASAREGLEQLQRLAPVLVVLDLMPPDLPGEDVCSEIRRDSDVPIVLLGGESSLERCISALDCGADDFLVRPFSSRELMARIRALLRRAGAGAEVSQLRLDEGRLVIDVERHEVHVGGALAELTPTEYRLLHTMARSPRRVFSRFELVNHVMGHGYDGYERTIDAHVKNLRRKIEPEPGPPRYVQTVHGVGYRLAVD